MGSESTNNKRKFEESDEEEQLVANRKLNFLNHLKRYLTLKIYCIFAGIGGKNVILSRLCPYLDTINRTVLDFDFEKLCSVSLTRINVYACLVCGKYFQGNYENKLVDT